MPCEIIPDTLDLEMETLEAINPDPSKPETFRAAYPFPLLRRSGQIRSLSFRTITLANDFVSATFAIDLGGRLIGLHDKRTGVDVLPLPKSLTLLPNSGRGVFVPNGLELLVGPGERPNALGPVDYSADESESGEVALTFHELRAGSGLGWQAIWTLSNYSPILRLNFEILNRMTSAAPGVSGLALRGFDGERVDFDGVSVWYDSSRRAGIGTIHSVGTFDVREPWALLRRQRVDTELVPHQLDRLEMGIVPVSGLAKLDGASSFGAMAVDDGVLHLLLHQPISGAKVVLDVSGQSLESSIAIGAKGVEAIDLSSVEGPITGCALLGPEGLSMKWMENPDLPAMGDTAASSHLRSAGWRGFGHWQLAVEALKKKKYEKADHHLENSLLYNGDDPLTWWLKAVVRRLMGEEGERVELLNAHFLSPLEPALRCESFLSQNEQGKDPSPILAPLANHPEALIDVTCMLIEVHLVEEATRLIDEALRHREQPMLRYLWAWLHLSNSKMEFEAAQHVQNAEKLPFEPPFPWRKIEKQALTELHARFPTMPGLKRWFDLADVFIED